MISEADKNGILAMKAQAENDESYQQRCIMGEKIFYYPSAEAYVAGHIYSTDGISEFRISRSCEFHFDKWFKEDDDE